MEHGEQKEIVKSFRGEYEKNVELFKKTKKNLIEENEKKVFSQTYILYDNSNVLKPTFGMSNAKRYVKCKKSKENTKKASSSSKIGSEEESEQQNQSKHKNRE